MSWDQYSQTPASNYLTGYFLTGMAPSSVKVAGSDIMADLAQFMSMPTSGGSANAQTITNTRQFGALFTGMWAVFVPGFTNTGSMTLAVDGLAAKNVFCNGAAALAGQVVSGIPAYCRYDGTQWQLVNPQSSSSSYTGTLTGCTTTPTGTINIITLSDGKTKYVSIASNLTATSNSNACTITGGPSSLTTSSGAPAVCNIVNNGSAVAGQATASSGTLILGTTNNSGGFNSTGIKGIAGCMLSFNTAA